MADAPHPTDAAAASPGASSVPPASLPPAGLPPSSPAAPPVVVKKYANRRLYNTETSSYITLDNLADMIRAGRDFVVYDAKSGEDITRGVLTQIIVEEESKGTSMLPTPFLRQLIGFYGDSLQGVVPRYLETAMSSFARQQQTLRQAVQQTISPFLPAGVEEMSRQNLAMIERAMSLFNPFHRGAEPPPAAPAAGLADAAPDDAAAELDRLRHEVQALRTQLATAQAEAVQAAGPAVADPAAAEALPAGHETVTAPEPPQASSPADPAIADPAIADPSIADPSIADPSIADWAVADAGPVKAGPEPLPVAADEAPAAGLAPAAHDADPARTMPPPQHLEVHVDAELPPVQAAEPPHTTASVTETAIHHAVEAVAAKAPNHPGNTSAGAASAGGASPKVSTRRGRAQRNKG